MADFILTYASMFNLPEALHTRFDAALADVKATRLDGTHAMLINNIQLPGFADVRPDRRRAGGGQYRGHETLS